jgi:signal transduction histidine kinase
MNAALRIVVVHEHRDAAECFIKLLQAHYEVFEWWCISTELEYSHHLSNDIDLIVLHYGGLDLSPQRALQILAQRKYDVPLIVISDTPGEDLAAEIMRYGAADYLLSSKLERLASAVAYALEQRDQSRALRRADTIYIEQASLNEAMLRSLPIYLAALDMQGQVVSVNDPSFYLRDTNRTAQLPIATPGVNYLDLCRAYANHSSLAASMYAGLRCVLRGDENQFTLEYPTGNGDQICWTSVRIAPMFHEQGVLIVYEDITERKQLEAQYLHAQKIESVGRLASGIAHDFNNILTAINGYAELGMLTIGDPSVHVTLDEIIKVSLRGTSLTRQLLSFSRQQISEQRVLDLNIVIQELTRFLSPLIGQDVRFNIDLLPEPAIIRVDRGQIEQVILNLVVNARDAMPQGGKLELRTLVCSDLDTPQGLALPEGSYVVLMVCDNGTGMSDQVRQRAMEPFFTTKQPGLGTGLGLATCNEIVKQYNGAVWIDSTYGEGTTVQVWIPQSDGEYEPMLLLDEDPANMMPSGTETILVVEDDESVRSIAARILEHRGYCVYEASSSDEAIDIASSNTNIDLLLVDLVIPRIDGRSVAFHIQQIIPSIKVLYMSGYTLQMAIQRGWMPQGEPFIQKPFTPQTLTQKIRSLLNTNQIPRR